MKIIMKHSSFVMQSGAMKLNVNKLLMDSPEVKLNERGIAKSGSSDRRCFKTAPNGSIDFKLSMEGSFGR